MFTLLFPSLLIEKPDAGPVLSGAGVTPCTPWKSFLPSTSYYRNHSWNISVTDPGSHGEALDILILSLPYELFLEITDLVSVFKLPKPPQSLQPLLTRYQWAAQPTKIEADLSLSANPSSPYDELKSHRVVCKQFRDAIVPLVFRKLRLVFGLPESHYHRCALYGWFTSQGGGPIKAYHGHYDVLCDLLGREDRSAPVAPSSAA